ncbi:elongation factor G [Chelativorans composti]|uniref:Elongation factor G n=1 Tax=Chelativorans composti TaxID=768533 RepID=A0ABW5DID8_9HYPH
METHPGERFTGPKCIAIVGPLESGKSTLLNAILMRTGAQPFTPPTSGPATHSMTTEACFATTSFMGESMTFVDCPGSVEFAHEAGPVIAAADVAVIVADADDKKLPQLQLLMRQLEELGIPRILFLNKIDKSTAGVRETLQIFQPISSTPLLLRQIPLRKDGIVVGSIDLALERAYIYQEHAPSEIAPIPDEEKAREVAARFSMLETLADQDDALLEQLLQEIEPPRDAIFNDLASDLRAGTVTPVLIGNAEKGHGVLRLLKTLRHDAPDVTATRRRLGVDGNGTLVQVMKTVHTSHGGKVSIARVLSGHISDGADFGAAGRISGIYRMNGKEQAKISSADEGETVALGKIEGARTGDVLGAGKAVSAPRRIELKRPEPVFSMAVRPADRKDEAKLSACLQKLIEEDPSLALVQRKETGETLLSGQGEMHLRHAKEQLERRYQIVVDMRMPAVPYLETIRREVTQRGRHKKQSGGHGQFGDVVLEIAPLPRGSGFVFTESITGGVVPKQYIPSVEAGVREAMQRGPLGFPVVDIRVNLADGSYHSVDSSDMAFQMAAKLAMREGLPLASPVLLEPILKVSIDTPSDATAKVTAILSQRRGQILGFETRTDLPGWDVVEALVPEAEMGNLIIELRSATAGAGTYRAELNHMAELTGRLADDVLAAQGRSAA